MSVDCAGRVGGCKRYGDQELGSVGVCVWDGIGESSLSDLVFDADAENHDSPLSHFHH